MWATYPVRATINVPLPLKHSRQKLRLIHDWFGFWFRIQCRPSAHSLVLHTFYCCCCYDSTDTNERIATICSRWFVLCMVERARRSASRSSDIHIQHFALTFVVEESRSCSCVFTMWLNARYLLTIGMLHASNDWLTKCLLTTLLLLGACSCYFRDISAVVFELKATYAYILLEGKVRRMCWLLRSCY